MAACRLAVLPGANDPRLAGRLDRSIALALAAATLASLGILLSRTLELNGGAWPTLLADVAIALKATHFGHVWAWRVPALAVAWIACAALLRRHRAWPVWVVLVAAALIAITRSDTGHAADHGDFTLAVWIDWLHLLGGATWVGSLFGMSLAVFPGLLRGGSATLPDAARIFQRLSTLCGVALVFVVACGIYNAATQLGGFRGLWAGAYGCALEVKLAVVLAMIAIGAHNRYVKLPRLAHAAATRGGGDRFGAIRASARAVLVESLLGIVVIGATAILLHQMPPADMASMPSMGAMAAPAPTPAISRIAAPGYGH